jgi:2-methylcitrate dehydratase PrpD
MNKFNPERTFSERLIDFVRAQQRSGVPADVRHEALRLLINQLKASVGATTHPAVRLLHDWALETPAGGAAGSATVLWFGSATSPAQAAVVNGALFEVLDFNDTYIPTFMHATSGVLPAVLALAEHRGSPGRAVLDALALGIECELACATVLMPTGYYRGFVPGGLVGAVGGAMACGLLGGLDDTQLRNALGLAMTSAFGTYESVGSMGLPYIMGMVARSGYTAYDLAKRGLDAPRTAFEGEKGMLPSYSNESHDKIEATLATLGQSWRLFGQSYKTVPTETITHAPIDCVMALLPQANLARSGRSVERLRFSVSPIVTKIADERRVRFGLPSSELTARFDTRFCAAAAWHRGRFTLDEMREAAYTDPAILALRERVDLLPDQSFATFDGCALDVLFSDGSTLQTRVPNFLGSPGNRLSDPQLSDLFRSAADGLLNADSTEALLTSAWGLDAAPSVHALLSLARLG